MGLSPGSAKSVERCYLGAGVLGALNDGCGTDKACDGVAKNFGGCADCHAPGIDGKLGGRDLLEASHVEFAPRFLVDEPVEIERALFLTLLARW